jgi:hypothetical protein
VEIVKNSEAPQHIKEKILNKYKEFWKTIYEEAQKNLNILKKFNL